MIILGIDPGFALTGWGIINKKSASSIHLVKYGCIETKAGLPSSTRLNKIFRTLTKLCQSHKPHALAMEDLFFNTNAKTAIKVGEARGVVIISAAKLKIPISHYTPLQVKQAVTGYGRADKQQVQKMVKTLLSLKQIPKPDDSADALAVAITHAFTVKR